MRFHVPCCRLLTAVMLVAVTNVYVLANGALSASSNKALLGRLVTTSNRPVLVNGGEAITGTVILSGSQISTGAAGQAIVQMDNVGTATIAPSSVVSVNFDSKNVTVRVAAGSATLVTAAGVKGAVLDSAGNPVVPGKPAAPASANNALYWGVAGVAVGGAALIWAIISHNRANDARDSANAANASAASLASQLAALRTCLAGQTTSPLKLCTSF